MKRHANLTRFKPLSIRQRITLWYAVLFLLMTNSIILLFFTAAMHIFEKQNSDNAARIAILIADKVDTERGRIIFNLSNKDRKKLSEDMMFALYSPGGDPLDGRRDKWLDRYPEKQNKIRRINRAGEPFWFIYDKDVYVNGRKAGWVRVALSGKEYIDDLDELVILWIVVFLFSLVFSALGGLFIAGRALKPVKAVATAARGIGDGDLSRRLELPGNRDEVGELAAAFNEMADNLEQTFAREKQFTSDVSHELRTPLAVITAHAENAEQVNELETYRQANAAMLQKSRHLQRMISQILTFAREREQADTMRHEAVDLSQVLADIAEEAAEWALTKNISVETGMSAGLIIKADMMLLTRLFLNLLDNAVKYGHPGGWVKVKAEQNSAGSVVITISDNGEGISETDLPHIFKRFYRADKSRSSEGTGLGLSFAEMIVRLHHGKITAFSEPGLETCFTVELPVQ